MLSRRYWVIKNIDWLMDEMVFHRTHSEYFKNKAIPLWTLNEPTGEADLDEITRRSEQV